MMLWHGGTLYLDGGKPTPDGIATTVANLGERSPTIYFNVPRGFDMLLPALERDAALRARFFAELDLVFYAAAALPDALWRRLEAVSVQARGDKVTMVSAWGSTETSPLVTQVHFAIDRAGVIGLPAPGVSLKLAPVGERSSCACAGPTSRPATGRPAARCAPSRSTTRATCRWATPASSPTSASRRAASSSTGGSPRTSSCRRAPG